MLDGLKHYGSETKTVGQIVKEYLKSNGYDGLVLLDEDCGCDLDDFEPCNQICSDCQAAYKYPYNEYGDFVLKTEETKIHENRRNRDNGRI